VRIEHDLLGDRAVPADAYYGIHSLRALENFSITAIANAELLLLDDKRSVAIRLACEEIREGKLHEEFVVDVIQGGAGTSTNMNANEVICNRALELLGHAKGEYQHLHPLDHVNLSQSTNDVYPTSIKLARARRLLDESTALVTALTPILGYSRSSEIAREALATGQRVYDLVLSKGWMTREQLDEVLRPEILTQPHFSTTAASAIGQSPEKERAS
jgi:aspartate ammonia-lyase